MANNKITIKCVNCFNSLRVPADKGEIAVTCPVCKKKFLYRPDSIKDTLAQIIILVKSVITRNKKSRNIFLITLIAVIILVMLILSLSNKPDTKNEQVPGLKVVYEIQE